MKKIFIRILITFVFYNFNLFSQTDEGNPMSKNDFVPEWAKKVVWYQIFPERFRNGDTSNDPTIETLKGSWPHDHTSDWEVHPWASDWYELQPYEKKNGKDVWFNIQRRRYGGDLQGIIDKLDYLKELGIGAIYLNPVFEAPSMHKYDGATYHHIDPNFGPDPEGDRKMIQSEIPHDPKTWVWTSADKLFLQLVKEVHKRGIRIIIDGVFNHMGINSWAFKDVVEKQEKSLYKNWFSITSWDDSVKGTKFKYNGWFGVKELPEIKQDENGAVKEPREYIFNITRRWMDPDGNGNIADGIDGWRLDVAFCIKHGFWKDWRKHVKSINPEAYIVAEIVDKIEVNQPYLEGDEFDAVMNYNYMFASMEYFFDNKTRIKTSEFEKLLEDLRKGFPGCVSYVMQNLLGSHDSQRMASYLVNKDKYKVREWGKNFDNFKGSNPKYDTRKPTDTEYEIIKLALIFQMTYIGAPYIYYGDEAGMWGANDPDCRKPMVWDDLVYLNETNLPDQKQKSKADKVLFNKDLFEHYKKLIAIHNEYEVLQTGIYRTLFTNDEKELFAFERYNDKDQVISIVNNSSAPQSIELSVKHNEYYKDLLNGNIIEVKNGKINFELKSKWGAILLKDYYK
ncbi:MAG: glycoside hydrolase family 13 protein [Ignavibacteriales bacterium]|nr:MAG: glycoside hydrolase family 13 protein [Ignavibacteriales bacterium]